MIAVLSKATAVPITVTCEPALEAQAQWLAEVVAKFENQGRGLAEGVSVQIGWSRLRLIGQPNGTIALYEPDYDADPFNKVRKDVSTTLRVLLAQNEILSKVGMEGVAARFDQKVVIRRGALSDSKIYAERMEPTAHDSGWYIGPAGGGAPSPEELEALWLYQLLSLRPAVLAVMALPPGTLVTWNGSEIETVLNNENRNVWQPCT